MKTVVTHNGRAHRDEFLSIGLLLHAAIIDPGTPIYRREPTSDELADPSCIVIDVGGDYDRELNNWDHHQMNNSLICTFSLLAENCEVPRIGGVTYRDLFESFPWYDVTIAMDSMGSTGLAKVSEHSKFPDEFKSPIEDSILNMMSREPVVSTFIKDVAYETINIQVEASRRLVDRLLELKSKKTEMWVEPPLMILQFDGDSFGIPQYRRKLIEESKRAEKAGLGGASNGFDIAITKNNRADADGWTLYRYNRGAVDFTQLKGDDRILYVHPEGYLATTDKKYERDVLRELISKAMKGA